MSALRWSGELALNLPLMDDTHRECIEILQAVDAAEDVELIPVWGDLLMHTEHHFGQEDRWMAATRFASGNCHSLQHRVVLQVMRAGLLRAEKGELFVLREMGRELAIWVVQHTQMMDSALATHLRRVGYNPLTGEVASPDGLPEHLIHGCAGACSSGDEALAAPEKSRARAVL
ncbi:hemerythrin domain-containing protein [Diaphorobacter aerolatus]|uniref:Hemerythrin n=1 Tax=Diaphorobacter aerolatus TaxID=1288495 RepID=A0A7H0GFQ1_9BURK|nr:hemerythrin domain-containing protein [Diaphorobacter aerolatus]QNP47117.1 hemerythrin [Diaphorobacter aerolatus]